MDESMRGLEVTVSKTVSESDVYLFAGITGDFAPNHVDEAFMAKTVYGRRIAHGALIVGYMSRASTLIVEKAFTTLSDATAVSLGYDRVRFLKPVFIGDTIAIRYRVEAVDSVKLRSEAKVEATNQHGDLVAVATHILKWVPRPPAPAKE